MSSCSGSWFTDTRMVRSLGAVCCIHICSWCSTSMNNAYLQVANLAVLWGQGTRWVATTVLLPSIEARIDKTEEKGKVYYYL